MNSKHRKLLGSLLSLTLGASSLGSSTVVLANESDGTDFDAMISDNQLSIGNNKISRSFSVTDGKVATTGVVNHKIDRTLTPGAGSEDFVISAQTYGDTAQEDIIANPQKLDVENATAMDRTGWTASLTNTSGGGFTSSDAGKLIDGNLSTNPDDYNKASNPWDAVIDMKEAKTVSAFSVDKRPGFQEEAYGINGSMGKFELYKSDDGENWTKFDEGEFTADDYNLHKVDSLFNVGDRVAFNFTAPQTARYFKVRQLSTVWNSDKQEFTTSEINFFENKIPQKVTVPTQALDRTDWTGSITPKNNGAFTDASFKSIIDGDLSTYPDEGGPGQGNHNGFPINVDLNLGSEQTVKSFSLDKRPGAGNAADGKNGTVGAFEVFTSDDGTNWVSAGKGAFTEAAYNLHQVDSLYNVGDRVYCNLNTAVTTQHIRLQFTGMAMGTAEEFAMAEVNLYSDAYQGPEYRSLDEQAIGKEGTIKTSDLTFEKAEKADTENGVKLTISYEPYDFGGTTFDIDEIYVAEDGKDYMRSFLEIKSSKDTAVVSYIDQDAFVIPDDDADTVWTHPTNAGGFGYGGLDAHDSMLGQPIYVDGLFMGSEFPVAETEYRPSDKTTQVRYYSGKSFSKMKEDNMLTTDDKFVSWQNVIGAARGTTVNEVKTDFFNYIEDIATPTVFRKQYNSWYDNMKNITDASIEKSFVGVEDGLSRNGVEPLDAYVVDDGWNSYAYNETQFNSEYGNNVNRTGFWEINDKFPNDFYTSTSLANKLQSTFGIWIGPRGGYGSEGNIAHIIEEAGTGYSKGDICIASHKYVDNFERLAKMWQKDYGVEYWKWDGFATGHCTNAAHDHMVGGPNNMYYTSDLWEHWTDLFENVRAFNASQGRPLFINATCFVELSPWMLQWVNTVWLQNSDDTNDVAGTAARHIRKIYYRDNVYYNLANKFQVQFPQNHFYNHEPIYGVSDNHGQVNNQGKGSNATDADFRQYMFANAMRGTLFWELYYSPSIVNEEKYEITMDVLDWMETNQDVLKTSRLHGGVPGNAQVYGYSAWKGQEGIVSVVNPTSSEQTYTLKLDAQAGVDASVKNLSYISVRPFVSGTSTETYSYGDSITVTVPANEMVIYHFGAKAPSAPKAVSAKNTDNNRLAVKFDQRVTPVSVKVDGKEITDFKLHDDYRTVSIPFSIGSLTNPEVEITEKDASGVERTIKLNVPVYRNGLILDTTNKGVLPESLSKSYDADLDTYFTQPTSKVSLSDSNTLSGTQDFSIVMDLNTTATSKALFNSGSDVALSIDENGYLNFKVGSHTLSSLDQRTYVDSKDTGKFGTDEYVEHETHTVDEGKINDGKNHRITASKTANGMLKIYIDGTLYASLYDKALIGLSLTGGDYTMADAGFSGKIGNIRISNAAKPLSEIEDEAPADPEELSSQVYSRNGWSASACSEASGTSNGDSGAMAAINDNPNDRWHTNYSGSDKCTDDNPHWIKVDFGKTLSVNKIDYKGRGNVNGSIKDYKLELLDANGAVVKTINGTFTSTTDLQKVDVTDDEGNPVSINGFKLTCLSTINDRDFAAAEELYAEGPNDILTGDALTDAKAALNSIKDLDVTNMTIDTAEAYQKVMDKVNATESIRAQAWDALKAEALEAANNLVDATAVITALNTTKTTYEGEQKGSDEAWAAFRAAYVDAQGARMSGEDATAVANAAEALLDAYAALEEVEPIEYNYDLLREAIRHAETVNTGLASYKDGNAKTDFGTKLTAAKALLDKAESQAQIDQTARDLAKADLAMRLKPEAGKLSSLK